MLQKMKEDNISRLDDHEATFCEQQYAHGSCYISLFKFKSFEQFNAPQAVSNFRHLLSCGTIVQIPLIAQLLERRTVILISLVQIPLSGYSFVFNQL